jgi:hypothetical protein
MQHHATPCNTTQQATVTAASNLTLLALARTTFVSVLGPLQDIMDQEKRCVCVRVCECASV